MKNRHLLIMLVFTLFYGVSQGQLVPESFGQIRTNLYIVAPDKSTVLMDGTLTQYDTSYSNDFDGKDARKMSNFSENWGMLRGKTVYVVERRHTMNSADSIFFKMWNMRIITYQLELIALNLDKNGRTAVLIDNYLKTSTPVHVNDTTRVPFAVTKESKSKAPDRFTLIFSLPEVKNEPPLEIVRTKVSTQYNSATLQWETEGYSVESVFEIERSTDGKRFVSIGDRPADSGKYNYQWTDRMPVQGSGSFYRVKIRSAKEEVTYGEIVNVHIEKVNIGISIYPNPAKDGHIKLNLIDQPKGRYDIKLLNFFGLTMYSKSIEYNAGKHIESLNIISRVLKGIYHLEVKGPDGRRKVMPVLF